VFTQLAKEGISSSTCLLQLHAFLGQGLAIGARRGQNGEERGGKAQSQEGHPAVHRAPSSRFLWGSPVSSVMKY